MKCDLCGKKVNINDVFSHEAVEESKLCSSCYAAVNDESCIEADESTLRCSDCQKPVFTYYQLHEDILCGKCFEQRNEKKISDGSTSTNHELNQVSVLPPIPVFSWLGLTEKSKPTFKNYSIFICLIQYPLAFIALYTYSFNNGAVMDFGGPFLGILILGVGSVVGLICAIASIVKKEVSSIGFFIALISHVLISLLVVFVLIRLLLK